MDSNKKLVAALILMGACARLLPHPWNFTPLVAIGLYAGARMAKVSYGVLATIAAMLLSDSILGFYHGQVWVYAAMLLPVLIARPAARGGALGIAAGALASSLAFFFVTNSAVWAGGNMYPHTFAGLTECFVAAVPFYRNQIAGDLIYTVALFGSDALLRRAFRLAPVAA